MKLLKEQINKNCHQQGIAKTLASITTQTTNLYEKNERFTFSYSAST